MASVPSPSNASDSLSGSELGRTPSSPTRVGDPDPQTPTPGASTRSRGSGEQDGGELQLKQYKCHLIWKHTKQARRTPGRELLNQTLEAHNVSSLALVAFRHAFRQAAENNNRSAEDRGFMVIGSAWIPDTSGSGTAFIEVNKSASYEEATCPEHYLSFRKNENNSSKYYFLGDDKRAFFDHHLSALRSSHVHASCSWFLL